VVKMKEQPDSKQNTVEKVKRLDAREVADMLPLWFLIRWAWRALRQSRVKGMG
jgi:hypothetical protein